MADLTQLAIQVGSIFANGEKVFQNIGKDPLGDITAGINVASFVQNAVAFRSNLLGLDSVGTSIIGNLLNKFNFAAQVASLSAAIQNNDSQGIAKGIVGVIGATAGVIGSIPGMPPNVALPARAINLLLTSTSLLLSDPTVWANISNLSHALSGEVLSKDFLKFAFGLGNAINGAEQSLISTLQSLFGQAQNQGSPLILDLNGNGIETLGTSAGIHFDHDGNGFAELSGWVGKDDGLLVLDKNGNGTIDNGGELFGNNTPLAGGGTAANGFAALADLDANHDGKIDANDAAFASLRVWKDANQDGITDAGELLTLAQAGVQSLATGYAASTTVDANGNAFKQVGSFTRADGTTATMTDVWFAADMARTVDKNPVAESDAIAALPDIAGFGNVHGLHQAMARDATGHLQTLVDEFAGTTDPVARKALVVSIVYAWAGVEGVAPGSRGGAIDARELAALEAFLGNGYGACAWAVAANDAVFEMRKVG